MGHYGTITTLRPFARYSNGGTRLRLTNSTIARRVHVLGTNFNDEIVFSGLGQGRQSRLPTVKIHLYGGGDWVEAKNSRASSFYYDGGRGSDSFKDRGGNNSAIQRPSTTSVEYIK